MKLWEILVPASSPGYPIKLKWHKEWDKKVREIAGGLTIMKPAQGEWISPSGKLYRDRIIPVRIMCTVEQIEKIAEMTIEHYSQEAVMYYAVSGFVKIKHRSG
jgi:hypothetical protein